MFKPRDDRKLRLALEEDDACERDASPTESEGAWYHDDPRTRRLATLVGGGYSFVTIEIAYATAAQPRLRRVATWEGFDLQPQFVVFRAWLADWQRTADVQVQDLRAVSIELIGDDDLALNPYILFVH